MKRIAICAALAATGLLAIPATSLGFKFGAKLNRQPDNSAPAHDCTTDGGEGVPSPCTRVLVSSETGLAGNNLTAPSDGVITQFKVRAGAAGSLRFKLVRLKNVTNGTAKGKAVKKTKTFQVQGNGFNSSNFIETFSVNVKVKKGDYIAVDSKKTAAERCTSGSVRQLIWSPVLKIGDPFRTNTSTGHCTLMVQAVGHK